MFRFLKAKLGVVTLFKANFKYLIGTLRCPLDLRSLTLWTYIPNMMMNRSILDARYLFKIKKADETVIAKNYLREKDSAEVAPAGLFHFRFPIHENLRTDTYDSFDTGSFVVPLTKCGRKSVID